MMIVGGLLVAGSSAWADDAVDTQCTNRTLLGDYGFAIEGVGGLPPAFSLNAIRGVAEEMVRRFWLGTAGGAYVGHSETYLDPQDILWWSKGGVLHGESPQRIAFLRKILESAPPEGLNNLASYYLGAGQEGRYYLFYFDVNQPAEYVFELAPGVKYKAEIIDPWAMTITPVEGTFQGKFEMKLPGKPFLAVRFQRAD